uniref:Nitronate monooxygenase domain-containing protein n=1 Tax=Hemiselmis tepida TaxID=464990 RepID=A0A7S0YVK3_9CRYP|mmetsp:Transcript_25236/g.63967  ORF Transcript_25236/g.63967 Transcript_25236/m.63967 type:complete len:620 (+) Transcript_25236:130-1989(+)
MYSKLSLAVLACLPLASDAFSFSSPVTTSKANLRPAAASQFNPSLGTVGRAPRAAKASLSSLEMRVPKIIQGGMGVQVSSWTLAREVNRAGELGVISGTAMETVLVRWLQMGDPGGIYKRALDRFPDQEMVKRVWDKYYVEGGKSDDTPFKNPAMWTIVPNSELEEATVLGNYCEVWLAKHEDDGTLIKGGGVGINCLTKIQLPTIQNLYGAMYAEVDYVIMGAGIPMEVPGILDTLAEHGDCKLAIDVDNAPEPVYTHFSPKAFWERAKKPSELDRKLTRPSFIPIVSSVTLAQAMLKRATGAGPTKGIQGFVIEYPTAGGHNAPPRGFRYDASAKSHVLSLNERGEPVYGEKDEVDLERFKKATKGLPFWLAGYYARPDKLQEVLALGGAGIQVGTSFAFTKESGLRQDVKRDVLRKVESGDLSVYTDPVASPTGFPFKVLELDDSLSTEANYEGRPRVCNLGYLRTAFMEEGGKISYRCASEPIDIYLKKGGSLEATVGRKCLCNGLMANAGMPQVSPFKKEGEDNRYVEEILITAGDDVNQVRAYMKETEEGHLEYTAVDVLEYLWGNFKDEYQREMNLYSHAEEAEDPVIRESLLKKKKELEERISEVDAQLKK